jgi:hypothetical protein
VTNAQVLTPGVSVMGAHMLVFMFSSSALLAHFWSQSVVNIEILITVHISCPAASSMCGFTVPPSPFEGNQGLSAVQGIGMACCRQ